MICIFVDKTPLVILAKHEKNANRSRKYACEPDENKAAVPIFYWDPY
jgi:hypothetical protein